MMYFDLHPDNKQVIEASLKHSGSMLFCSTATESQQLGVFGIPATE